MINRRSAPRFALGLPCSLRVQAGVARRVRLIDLSSSGCRIEIITPLHAHDLVWVAVGPVRAIGGTVIWALGDFAGIHFNEPMHASVVDDLIAKAITSSEAASELHEIADRGARQARQQSSFDSDRLSKFVNECMAGSWLLAPPIKAGSACMEP